MHNIKSTKNRKIVNTKDGSSSIYLPEWNESYHSSHGAIQEAYHVYIANGLKHWTSLHPTKKEIHILEIGFGTGLNAFITTVESAKLNLQVKYSGMEAYPVEESILEELNYSALIAAGKKIEVYRKMHALPWESYEELTPVFQLRKQQLMFDQLQEENTYDLVYFDAFGARVQPELWTEAIFSLMYKAMKKQGVLVTYSSKGSAKRAMQAVGFSIEKLQGPPGKRHMLRATK